MCQKTLEQTRLSFAVTVLINSLSLTDSLTDSLFSFSLSLARALSLARSLSLSRSPARAISERKRAHALSLSRSQRLAVCTIDIT